MDEQVKIISFMRLMGPILPVQAAKQLKSEILLASVYLSELASQGKVKLSALRIGGSPLYYLPEHKEKLENFIYHLDPKDQQTFNLLKEKKLLREKDLDLFSKVSLRGIKDFAVPLNVTINAQKELFWKWYLLDDQQATQLIQSLFFPPEPELPPSPPLPPPPPLSPETAPPLLEPEPKPKLEKKAEEKEPLLHQQKLMEIKEEKKEKRIKEEKTKPKKIKEEKKPPHQELLLSERLESSSLQKIKETKPKRKEAADNFIPQIESYLQERNIKVENKEVVKKKTEINLILEVPSVIGKLTYFGKVKDKKRCDEKDLSSAYMEAQAKKLPLLFLYTNEITKKAQALVDSGAFENLIIKKIE